MNDNNKEVRKKLLAKYGSDGQLSKLKEEMHELIDEIDDWLDPCSTSCSDTVFNNIKEEFVDVLNVAVSLKETLFSCEIEFQNLMDKKVEKSKKYL